MNKPPTGGNSRPGGSDEAFFGSKYRPIGLRDALLGVHDDPLASQYRTFGADDEGHEADMERVAVLGKRLVLLGNALGALRAHFELLTGLPFSPFVWFDVREWAGGCIEAHVVVAERLLAGAETFLARREVLVQLGELGDRIAEGHAHYAEFLLNEAEAHIAAAEAHVANVETLRVRCGENAL